MRTELDRYSELSLQRLVDEDVLLICYLVPMLKTTGHKIVPDIRHEPIEIRFGSVAGYFVLPEVAQAAIGFRYADSCHLSHVEDKRALTFFKIPAVYPSVSNRHLVVRTAHYIVNVFTDVDPQIVMPGQGD